LRNYIADDNPSAARKIAQRIIDIVNLLADQPLLGGLGRIHNARKLVITNTPYTLACHATEDIITILSVFHQARKWPQNL